MKLMLWRLHPLWLLSGHHQHDWHVLHKSRPRQAKFVIPICHPYVLLRPQLHSLSRLRHPHQLWLRHPHQLLAQLLAQSSFLARTAFHNRRDPLF